jgi:Protein of unknown function (DUF2478)
MAVLNPATEEVLADCPRASKEQLDAAVAAPKAAAAVPLLAMMRPVMFDAQCDLAALVYDEHQDPDAVLRDFASDVKARGFRAVGMVQAGQCADSSLSAVLVHNGEKLLLAPVAVLAWHVAPDCVSPPAFTSYSPRSAATGSACRCEGCGCKGARLCHTLI